MEDYAIWSNCGENFLYIPYKYNYNYTDAPLSWNPAKIHCILSKFGVVAVYVAIIYVVAIHSLERRQRSRKAYSLRKSLFLWNLSLAIFSIIGTYRFGEEFLYATYSRSLLHSICYSLDPTSNGAFWGIIFVASKFIELGDTVFVVLRKKPLIFLHWYHHAVVLVFSWRTATELSGAARWFIFMNFFVHSIMYSYYSAKSCGITLPRFVPIAITTLQTMQMIIAVTISFILVYVKYRGILCQQTVENLAFSFAVYLSFAALFMKFFYNAYMVPKARREQQDSEGNVAEKNKMK